MMIFSVVKKYRLGERFAEENIFSEARDSSIELIKYVPDSSDNHDKFLLLPRHRSGRPGISMTRHQSEWTVIYQFTEMCIMTIGVGFIFFLMATVGGGLRVVLGVVLLPLSFLFFWIQGVCSAIYVHHFFKRLEEKRTRYRRDGLDTRA